MASMETYYGHVRTPLDAIILFEACRLGVLPRVQRRLSEKERLAIRSGSVFVWDEREAGMRRWTDGKSWSASRVSGSFLTYREMEGKRGGGTYGGPLVPSPPRRSPDVLNDESDSDGRGDDGPDGYRYKPDGLMKQSFSIQTSSRLKLHLISYYSRVHAQQGQDLMQPSHDPALKFIRIPKGMYPDATSGEADGLQQAVVPAPSMHHHHPPPPHPHNALPTVYPSQMAPSPVGHHQVPPQAPPVPSSSYRYSQPYGMSHPMQQAPISQPSGLLPMRSGHPHMQPVPQQVPPQPSSASRYSSQGPQYGWPPSPASTPPNYLLQSVAPPPPSSTAHQQSHSNGIPDSSNGLPSLRSLQGSQMSPSPMSQHQRQYSQPQQQQQQQQQQQHSQQTAQSEQQYVPQQMHSGDPNYGRRNELPSLSQAFEVQDIPVDKVSWGEDVRALKELNKTFSI
ncbi:Gti1/Pac2 family-domain-containing protein [Dipodascopsis uninucleata]